MWPFRLSFAILLLPALLGCATSPPPMQLFRSPGVEKIPIGIVLLPLFSTEPARSTPRILSDASEGYKMYSVRSGRSESHDEMYIAPPTETTLKVTGPSERLTGLLSMELMQRGFKLRELPVTAPVEGENAFAVSLSVLDELRERANVRAILIGNAFFASRYSDADTHVTDLYIKMVNVETLEVMCQVAMPYDESGWRVDDVARRVADALAYEADLQVSSDQE